MDLYILGIGGTFMGHLALLAQQLGFNVSGCDQNVYSPMKEMLVDHGISYDEGYDEQFLRDSHQCYVVGNAISRGNPMVEAILNQRKPMVSGPQWLFEQVLHKKWVIAVAGTHGKTTTTSMITWILKSVGLNPGYLIGGAAKGFERAADIGDSDYFVIEADEYDTAFFDKRSKFIHYRPKTLILNNLEFDHADIFQNIDEIKKTFHHLVRIVPSQGRVIYPHDDSVLLDVVSQGCWSESFGLGIHEYHEPLVDPEKEPCQSLHVKLLALDSSHLEFSFQQEQHHLKWSLIGRHNAANAAAALAAVEHIGIPLKEAIGALASFPGVARRMDLIFESQLMKIYDDFAHHPTAIALSLDGLRAQVGHQYVIAIIEPRSNTMAMGIHQNTLIDAVVLADEVYWLRSPNMTLDLDELAQRGTEKQQHFVCDSATILFQLLLDRQAARQANCIPAQLEHWLCMSNGSFSGLFQLFKEQLRDKSQ